MGKNLSKDLAVKKYMRSAADRTFSSEEVRTPEAIERIMGAVTPDMIPVLGEMEGCFEQEFDYTREGANLRRMVKEVQPHFAGVSFPEPYDLTDFVGQV